MQNVNGYNLTSHHNTTTRLAAMVLTKHSQAQSTYLYVSEQR